MTLTLHQSRNVDPTRTATLRRRFQREMSKRFLDLVSVINAAVRKRNALVLNLEDVDIPRFDFPRSDQKARGFMQWVNQQVRAGVLEARFVDGQLEPFGDEPWTNLYVRSSYQKGIEHARETLEDARITPRNYGLTASAGDTIEAAFNTEFHADRVGLMYSRTFEELQGVTEAMGQQMRRTLSQGMMEGINPREMASRLNKRVRKIGRTRAMIVARTETIRAHNHANLREFEAAGVEGVTLKAEFLTAGDNRVCDRCQSLEGRVFSLEEAQSIIPVHPQCRCTFLPVDRSDRG